MTQYKIEKQTMRQKRLAVRQMFLSRSFRVCLVALIAVFGVMNLVQITKMSTKGYQINELENNIQSLNHEVEKLNVQIAQHRSMNSIQDRLANLNMVAAENIEYISLPGSSVARR